MTDRESILPLAVGLVAALLIHVTALGLFPVIATAASHHRADDSLHSAAHALPANATPTTPPARAAAAHQPLPATPPAPDKPLAEKTLTQPPTPSEPPLGSDRGSDTPTISWIAYDDYRRLMAAHGGFDQPALQDTVDPTPGGPISHNPTPPAAPALTRGSGSAGSPGQRGVPGSPGSPGPVAIAMPPTLPLVPPISVQHQPDPPKPPPEVTRPEPTSPPDPITSNQLPAVKNQQAASPRPPISPADDPGQAALVPPGPVDLPGVAPTPIPATPPVPPSPRPLPTMPQVIPQRQPPPPALTRPPATMPAAVASPAIPFHPPTGDGGSPASGAPASVARPTAAPRTDREADPFSATNNDPVKVVPGGVVTGKGIEIKTVQPNIPAVAQISEVPDDPEVVITFGKDGQVVDVKLVKSSGYPGYDAPILASLYKWRASGEFLKQVKDTFQETFRLILSGESDVDTGP